MATYVTPKINTEYVFYISLVSQANTKIFQVNPTLAAGDFKVAVDDAAPANPATLPAVDADFTRRVKVILSASEMNGGNITFIASDAAGAEWCDLTINIQTTARQVDDLAFPTTSGRSLDVTATGAAGVDWANVENQGTTVGLTATTVAAVTTAAAVTTVNGLAANVITAASMAADASAEIADAVWDEDATAHQTQGTFGQAIGDPAADTNTIYKAVVTDAAGATVGVDVVAVKSDTAAILADTGTDGVVVAAASKTGYALSSAGIQAIWDALTSALTTAGSIGKLLVDNINATISSRATPAQVNTEVVDALATDTYAEPGQGAPAATTTLAAKIGYLYKSWRNKKEQTSTTFSLYDDAGSTVDQKSTVSDDATTATRGEIASGP